MPQHKIELSIRPKACTREEVISELHRELKTRWRVYPRWVGTGKLAKSTAEKRLTLMMAAIQMLENPQGELL